MKRPFFCSGTDVCKAGITNATRQKSSAVWAVFECVRWVTGRERAGREHRELTLTTLKMGSNVLRCHIMYVFFFSSPCVYVYMCIRSGSLETGGSWLAGCRRAMFGRVPARLAEGRWCCRVVAKCGRWADRQTDRQRVERIVSWQECCWHAT